MRTLLARFLHWRRTHLRTLNEATQDMCVEFAATFPGKCLVCSYYAWGRREGMTTEATPAHGGCTS